MKFPRLSSLEGKREIPPKEIRIGHRQVVVRYKKMKHLRMRVSGEGTVQISAPRGTPLRLIRDFVIDREDWILKAEEAAVRKAREAWRFESGMVDYLGRPFRIEWKPSSERQVHLGEGVITLCLPDPEVEGSKEALLESFLRKGAARVFNDLLEDTARGGADYPFEHITLKPYAMKKRLGTCYPDRGLIHLNTRLIHCEPEAIRYVLWHELVHLKHPDHGRGFHEELARRCPRYKERKKILETQIKGYL